MVKKSTMGELEKRRARRLLSTTTFQKLFTTRSPSRAHEAMLETLRAMKKLKRATKLRPTLKLDVNNADGFYQNPVSIIKFTLRSVKAELFVTFMDGAFKAFYDRERVRLTDNSTVTGFGGCPSVALWDLIARIKGKTLKVKDAASSKNEKRKFRVRRVVVPKELVVDGWIDRG